VVASCPGRAVVTARPGSGLLAFDSVLAVVSVAVLLAALLFRDRAQHGEVDGRPDLVLGLDGAVEELTQERPADTGHQPGHHGEEERQVLWSANGRALARGELTDGDVGDLVVIHGRGDAGF